MRSISSDRRPGIRPLLLALAAASVLVPVGALAQSAAPAPAATSPSQNATVNLIRALVRKGVLAQAEADEMIAQAESEAAAARSTAQAAQSATQAAQTAVAASSPASAQPGTSVRYVPQFVRDQIKEEVKAEVLADAKTQGIVAPDAVPSWVRGIKISGDLRLRSDNRFFDRLNELSFVNVGAINAGDPYNTDPGSNPNSPPIINSYRNRYYTRVRARIGLEAKIDPILTAYFRVATGDDTSPVSTNQTLGGYFAKDNIWLDRAYLDLQPIAGAHVMAGRMANPFKLPELMWDEDLNLDGVAASYERPIAGGFSAYGLGGFFPLDFVPDSFPDTATSTLKIPSHNAKWLAAGQVGVTWKSPDDVTASLNAAYYRYAYIDGIISPSCLNVAQYCQTDYRRPGFLQKGNTLFALRDNFTIDPNDQSSPQYYGLASKFQILEIAGDVNVPLGDDLKVSLTGHWSKNLGYDVGDLTRRATNPSTGLSQIANNNEQCSVALVGGFCPVGKEIFRSGDIAWLVRASIGTPDLTTHGDWMLSASYRSIAPDALLDAFTDSDFHLGGTNTKGFTVAAAYGVLTNTILSAKYLNADEKFGPRFRVSTLLVDLETHF